MSLSTNLTLLLLLLLISLLQARRDDAACQTIRCMKGFRCVKGNCIKQERSAVKNLCVSHKWKKKIDSISCKPKDRTSSCNSVKNSLTCGFTNDGNKIDFTNDCSPCLDATISYYYRLPCSDAPIVCTEVQECINGKCYALFDTDNDRDLKICNKSVDCDSLAEICVANKCVSKHDLLKTLRQNSAAYSS